MGAGEGCRGGVQGCRGCRGCGAERAGERRGPCGRRVPLCARHVRRQLPTSQQHTDPRVKARNTHMHTHNAHTQTHTHLEAQQQVENVDDAWHTGGHERGCELVRRRPHIRSRPTSAPTLHAPFISHHPMTKTLRLSVNDDGIWSRCTGDFFRLAPPPAAPPPASPPARSTCVQLASRSPYCARQKAVLTGTQNAVYTRSKHSMAPAQPRAAPQCGCSMGSRNTERLGGKEGGGKGRQRRAKD